MRDERNRDVDEDKPSTWQPDIFGRGSRSVAEQPELFPADLGSKPKPVVAELPDPDQLDLFAD